MTFKAPKPSKKTFEFKTAAQAEYDWTTLLDGNLYELKSGEHFGCKPNTFGQMVRKQARKAYKTVQVSIDVDEADDSKGTIHLKATPMTDEQRVEEDAKREQEKLDREADKAAAKAEAAAKTEAAA